MAKKAKKVVKKNTATKSNKKSAQPKTLNVAQSDSILGGASQNAIRNAFMNRSR